MPKLNEVFGISTSIPTYTYVDRAGLDAKFAYLLTCDRHLVIHGASKQGKTVLRRKAISKDRCLIVQCSANSTLELIYLEILRQIGAQIPTQISRTLTLGTELKGQAAGEIKIPFVGSADMSFEGAGDIGHSSGRVTEPVGINPNNLGYVAEEIRKHNKRVIIEDFHYLPEDEKKRLAFDLKALWDLSVFFVIIGIWAEQNLLNFYNGDLSGRIEEIDVQWTNHELDQVICKGENALNVIFSDEIRQSVLSDANQNVGLLQRIMEKYCFEAGIYEQGSADRIIDDRNALTKCRVAICKEEAPRFRQFCEAVIRGYKGFEESELKVYQHIVRVCIESPDSELSSGLHRDPILSRVQSLEPRVRLSDLSAALNKLDRLQADRSITPLVLSYNSISRKVLLVDKELLFFRKYGNPIWPWQEVVG